MAKDKLKTVYICTSCGESTPRWMGRCPSCGEWNTLEEEVVREDKGGRAFSGAPRSGGIKITAQRLQDISTSEEKSRIVTGISESMYSS